MMYEPIDKALKINSKGVIQFRKSEGEKIGTYLIPALRKVPKEVKLKKNVEELFQEEPLKVKIYLDRLEEAVTALIQLNYGDVTINPLDGKTPDTGSRILIREVEREEAAVSILKSFNFQEENSNYILKEEKDIITFISEGISKFQELGEIYYSEAFKNIKLHKKASVKGEAPSLVIAPTSLLYNWQLEIERFAPDMKVLVISGSKRQREEQREQIHEADVVITSYPLIGTDIEEYEDIKFKYCILDEAQNIKNPNSQNTASVKSIKAEGYFALTGTPIENSLTELWSIFDFIMPGHLLNHSKFRKVYEAPIIEKNDKAALEELHRHARPFILRILKRDVALELPPKIEQKLKIEMTEEQKKLYAAYLQQAREEVGQDMKAVGFNRSTIKVLAALTRLRQICCDPSMFLEDYLGDSGKLQALEELIEETVSNGHKVLLFSQFTSALKNISSRLSNMRIDHMYLDGQVKSEARMAMVEPGSRRPGHRQGP